MVRATVCLTVDFDAVSPWLHGDPADNTPINRSRGVYGADVGTPRLLALFDRHDVETTWFVPGHTVESFPAACEDVWAAGHPIEHHGWSHRKPGAYDSRAAEQADLEGGIDAIESLTGRRPTGYRSPSWDFSEHTVDLLESLGFEWDSSAMAHDFQAYRLNDDDAPPDGPYDRGEPTDLVEIPVSWQRDDFPPFGFVGTRGFVDEASVFRMWREQFDWCYEREADGVFVLTMHPQVMGQGHRIPRLEEFIEYVAGKPDTRFASCGTVAGEFDE